MNHSLRPSKRTVARGLVTCQVNQPLPIVVPIALFASPAGGLEFSYQGPQPAKRSEEGYGDENDHLSSPSILALS